MGKLEPGFCSPDFDPMDYLWEHLPDPVTEKYILDQQSERKRQLEIINELLSKNVLDSYDSFGEFHESIMCLNFSVLHFEPIFQIQLLMSIPHVISYF